MPETHRSALIHSSGKSDYRTPPELIEALRPHARFTIDLAATADSSVCWLNYLGPDQPNSDWRDALQVPWAEIAKTQPNQQGGLQVGWLNPPYSLEEIKQLREQAKFRTIPDLEHRLDALRVEKWAEKACNESLAGFTSWGLFPYAPQTDWFRTYVMGHGGESGWWGHAALDYWRIPHRVSFLNGDGSPTDNTAGVNSCLIHWGPNPGFVGPWVPSGRYWSYR